MPPLPPLHHEEAAQLLAFLEAQRHAVRIAAHGLTDDQARTAASASSLTIGGLIKHLTSTEHNWVAIISDPGHDWGDPSAYQDAYTMGPGETLADLLSAYEKVGAETESLIAASSSTTRSPSHRTSRSSPRTCPAGPSAGSCFT